jgi:predicted GIY-YIG superfamily endonuclease
LRLLGEVMIYVYTLQSIDDAHFYTGATEDLRRRINKHNAGEVPRSKTPAMATENLHGVCRPRTSMGI